MSNYFVTGTDTNVGKTVVSAALCLKLKSKYWKPIQTGSVIDSNFVKKIIGSPQIVKETYRFKHPLAPTHAANLEKRTIRVSKIMKQFNALSSASLIIEGAGGILVPLTKNYLVIDLIKELKAKVVLVTKSSLGTINHTLMTIECLRARGVEPHGLIFVGKKNLKNEKTILEISKVKFLARLPLVSPLTKEALRKFSQIIKL